MSWLYQRFDLSTIIVVSLDCNVHWITNFVAFIACQWKTRVGHFTSHHWNTLSYTFYSRTALRPSLLSGATSVCDVGPSGCCLLKTSPPFFSLRRACPQWACLVSCFLSLHDPYSFFSSRACNILMLILCASSHAAAVNTLPGGIFQRCRHLTALPGLHLIQSSVKFRHKTLQHQLRLALHFRSQTNKHQSRIEIIIWHEVINNSLTPHSSNFKNPLCPTALIQELRALTCDIAAIIYCQRTGSPDVLQLLRQSFLVISPVRHLLSHRKQHNLALVRQYSVLHLGIHLELQIYFLLSQHFHHPKTLTKKKSRLNNRRRRSLHRRTLLAQQQQSS